ERDIYLDTDMMELQQNLADVYFAYDESELTDASRSALQANSAWLQRPYVSATIQIEGHCDERGTVEYNQALGERRARAAYDYLVSLGVPDSRLEMISYGKERPQCTESDEDCWQRNRRAHFKITAK
ncbi:MAG: peptidoglycan-associated lipoprotein Pal, partial [Acidobacteria bacterium]|nr:peptidoglycan-associated lipoprotein Pal [Acidobacteriota bacterium]